MATKSTSTTNAPNDSSATKATLNYILSLQNQLAQAKTIQATKTASYKSAVTNEDTLKEEYTTALAATTVAKSSLEDAINAQEQINTITNFFKLRAEVTSDMVNTAQVTATTMYEASELVGTIALQRVQNILMTANDWNSKHSDPTESSDQWTNLFVSTVQSVQVKGQAALTAATSATQEAFLALVDCQQVHYRSQQYYNQFQTYQQSIGNVVSRLQNEYILLKLKSDDLDLKWKDAKLSVFLLKGQKNTADFNVAQLQAEYSAAQQGASYTGSPTSPVS